MEANFVAAKKGSYPLKTQKGQAYCTRPKKSAAAGGRLRGDQEKILVFALHQVLFSGVFFDRGRVVLK
jgi:hypothetical protein